MPHLAQSGEDLLRRLGGQITSGEELLASLNVREKPARPPVVVEDQLTVGPERVTRSLPGPTDVVDKAIRFADELGIQRPRSPRPPPEPPDELSVLAEAAQRPLAADVTAVPLGSRRPDPPPTMRAATPPEQVSAALSRASRDDQAALQERFEKIPAPVRVAGSALRGVANATTLGQIDELVDKANKVVAATLGIEAPKLTTDEVLDRVERSFGEKAAEVLGFIGGAGKAITTGNQLLASLAPAARQGSKARALLQSFDPSKPASVGTRALQGALEGLPFDLAFDADSLEERGRNVALGLVIGSVLGPAFGGRIGSADEAVESATRRAAVDEIRAGAPEEVEARITQAEARAVGIASEGSDQISAMSVLSADPRTSLEGRLRDQGAIASGKPREGPLPDIRSRASIVKDLGDTLDVPVRIGRFRHRGALGIFKIGPEVIRSKVAQDIEVVAHEAGHFLQKALFGRSGPKGGLLDTPLNPWAAELKPIAAGISDESISEGFAEFVRRYLTNVDAAEQQAPGFFQFFEETLGQRMPDALAMLRRAREDYRVWREAPAQARVRAARARPDDVKPELVAEEGWRKLRTSVVDDLTPLRHAVERAEVDQSDIAADAGTLADLARGSAGQAELMIEDGMIDFGSRRVVGNSYKQVFDPLRNEAGKLDPAVYDDWADYAVATRVKYLYDTRQDVKFLGVQLEDAFQTILELETPEFMATLRRFQEYNNGLLDWLEGAGVLSPGSRQAINQANEVYVPLMRVVDDKLPTGTGGRKLTNRKDPIKRIRGSGRLILDPGEVTLERTYQYTRLAAKQEVSNAIFELAQREGMGHLIEAIPAPLKAIKVRTDEALKALRKTGGGGDDELADALAGFSDELLKGLPDDAKAEMLTFFRPGEYLGADNVISVLVDGKRKFFEVDPELFKALEGIDEIDLPRWMNVLASPARTLRAGATLAPEFGPRNVIRDQLMAGIQSEYGFVPFLDMVRGMASLLKNDEYARAFKAGGGARATLVGLDRASIRKSFRDSTGVENVIMNPMDALRAVSSFFENSTRVGEVRLALKELRAQGVPEGEAVRRATKAGREVSVDFGRSGTQTKQLRMMAAFWNARLQGYDKLFRTFKANPARTTARAAALITVPSVLEYMANRDDPEYFEIPQWQRDLFWLVKTPGGHWLRFPKPFELGIVFGTIPQRILEWMDRNDPEGFEVAAKDFFKDQASGFVPVPTFAVPLIDNYANFNGFLERPIVPRGLTGVDPEEQFTNRTSEVSKQLGRMLNTSPAKVDNLVYAYTGGLGRLALQTVDFGVELAGERELSGDLRPLAFRLPGVRGFTVRPPGSSSESIERLYRLRATANQKRSTYDKLRREKRTEEAEAYYAENKDWILMRTRLERIVRQLSRIRDRIDAVRANRALSADAKAQQIAELERRMTEIAATALGRERPPRLSLAPEPAQITSGENLLESLAPVGAGAPASSFNREPQTTRDFVERGLLPPPGSR